MKKILFREPIHLKIRNRGKLRKISHHCLEQSKDVQNMLLTPTNVVTHDKCGHSQKYYFYLKKKEKEKITSNDMFNKTHLHQEEGSYRAIHTAYPSDSIRGFPSRSVTPIKPFRRGIRTTAKQIDQTTIQISQVKKLQFQGQNMRGNSRTSHFKRSLYEACGYEQPEYKQDIEHQGQFEEFFKYDAKGVSVVSNANEELSGKLAGTHISPFNKYQIRQIKGFYSADSGKLPQCCQRLLNSALS